jgi:hypothetical protein
MIDAIYRVSDHTDSVSIAGNVSYEVNDDWNLVFAQSGIPSMTRQPQVGIRREAAGQATTDPRAGLGLRLRNIR